MAQLSPGEQEWCDLQPWLLSIGYQFRPRLRPDWVASWATHPVGIRELKKREDFIRHESIAPIMDAIRLSDNYPVMMKKIWSREYDVDDEQDLCEYFSSLKQRQDPDNNCVPIHDVLRVPGDSDHVIIIMPLLRKWRSPRFDTIGETLDMLHQAFKVIQYMHRNHIAHRDCTNFNFMMDGSEMYPEGFHPASQERNPQFTGPAVQKYTRTQRPPQYYWIDFGLLAVPFDPSTRQPRAIPVHGGDKSVPEHRDLYKTRVREPTDPFATDIYYLGNFIRQWFTEGLASGFFRGKFGYGFLKPLVEAMVQEDPTKRPNINQCVIHLEEIIHSQYSWKLRSQVWHRSDNPLGFIYRFFPHWARRIVYIITQTPAIPSRKKPPSPYLRLYTHFVLALFIIVPVVLWYLPAFRQS